MKRQQPKRKKSKQVYPVQCRASCHIIQGTGPIE
jgi:hypothetical protein